MKRPHISLLLAVSLGVAVSIIWLRESRSGDPSANTPTAPRATHAMTNVAEPAPRDPMAALRAEPDAARRKKALRAWADGIPSAEMPKLFAWLLTVEPVAWRAELREALFFSWTSRDLVAVAEWFGRPGGAQELRQEGRDQLVAALRQCDPEQVVAALNISLPPAVSRELYGPYFRDWAATDPAAAGAMLARLSAGLKSRRVLWDDLTAQVAAQWASSDPKAAAAWVDTLPEGRGRSRAAVQMSYGWVERDAPAAAAHAARSKDAGLLSAVAGKWAESDPVAAAVWAEALPDGLPRSRAIAGAVAIWGQSDPRAATAYAVALPDENLRTAAVAAAVSAWGFSAPDEAAAWVGALPECPLRDRALAALGGDTTTAAR